MTARRTIRLVIEQPARRASKSRLHGYGIEAVMKLAGCSKSTVNRAIAAKDLDMTSMQSVAAWVQGRKK